MITGPAVAIIGMAGKFPGAQDVASFWANILAGRDSISHFTAEELESRDAAAREHGRDYVAARGILEGAELFDAEFFGISPRDAELMDPQHRLFLESCWNALESAGYDSARYKGPIGIFGGCSLNTYLLANLCGDRETIERLTGSYQAGEFQTLLGNDKDFLASRVAYKLNLQGPSVVVQGACSTSLVAISQAAASLLTYQCDMALAGGVSITFPQKRGHVYQEGGMGSRDGQCRAFDAGATGAVFGHGVGVVLLKRLEDAVAGRDDIAAVILGFAIGNDGSQKAGYMAPGVEGQARVIAAAQAMAGVSADSIGYIEAHGTATPLGDPIEIAALTQAFRATTQRNGFCAVGTAKANIGHIEHAAGAAGVMRAALSLRNRVIPPTAHFREANPLIEFANTPFYVNRDLVEWKSEGSRRAGVSAFGVGGVNAHVVLEEAPEVESIPSARAAQLICVSARTDAALDAALANLGAHFAAFPETDLADAAWTLQAGRRSFDRRAMLVCGSASELSGLLNSPGDGRVERASRIVKQPQCAFLFPGQGSQFRGMGRRLYESEPVYREHVDGCAGVLRPWLDTDIRQVLFDPAGEAAGDIGDTVLSQPALFVTEYALARLMMDWGIAPAAMAGHSLGEFVAAALAGVMSVEDALRLVVARARLMQACPRGAMVSVHLGEQELRPFLQEPVSLAAANSSCSSVAAGPFEAIGKLERELARLGIRSQRLKTSHAFHSSMLDPMLEAFAEEASRVTLKEPSIRLISSVTGGWMEPGQATDPYYWASHCRKTVRFGDALDTLSGLPRAVFLEAGPGNALTTLAAQQSSTGDIPAVSSLLARPEAAGSAESVFEALGRLWLNGFEPNWERVYAHEIRRRVHLPTYPFERKRFWVDPPAPRSVFPKPASPQPDSRGEDSISMSHSTVNEKLCDPDRAARLQPVVASLLEGLSGIVFGPETFDSPLTELGFDSLSLTQATLAVQRKFGVKVTFRQMLDPNFSIAALAERIDSLLAPEAFAAEAPPSAPDMRAADAAAPNSAMERIFKEQMQTMARLFEQQLAALQPNKPAAAAPAITPAEPGQTSGADAKVYTPFKPIQTSGGTTLTGVQKDHLENLIATYQKRTAKSKKLTQIHRGKLADPRVVAGFRPQWKEMVYPIVVDRSRGSRLWDVDGNEYIDILNGFGAILLGHSPQWISEAVKAQIEAGVEIGPMSPLAGEVATLLCGMTGNERATFCNSGSEAVMVSLRLARAVTGRDKVVYFKGSYHGSFDEVLVRGAVGGSIPIAPGIPVSNTGNVSVLEYGADGSLEYVRNHAAEIAAVLVEPIQSRNPALRPREFLLSLRQITEQAGVALIFDEVVTGFRIGPGGAQEYFGIRADMATYGKVIGGGYPIGALAGKSLYMDALDGGMWQYGDDSIPAAGVTFFAATFVRHPLALAAAKAVLQHLGKSGPALQSSLNDRVGNLVQEINRDLEQAVVGFRINHFASWFYLALPAEMRFGTLLYYYLRLKNIHIQEGFPCFFTTEHTDEEMDRVRTAFRDSIREMQAGGLLPSGTVARMHPLAFSGSPAEVPITESQREIMLAAHQGDEANCAFNESLTLRFTGEVCHEDLVASIRAVAARHDALRSTVHPTGESLRIADSLDAEIPIVDLTALGEAEREAELGRRIGAEAETPFDLTEGPLVRVTLLKMSKAEAVLIFTAHHMVMDGWSANQIFEDAGRFYSAAVRGVAPELEPLMPFSSYALRDAARAGSAESVENEAYWVGVFSNRSPVLELPTDRPRPAVKSYEGATIRQSLGSTLSEALKKASVRQGCTLYVTLLSAFQILLHRLTRQSEVVVGISAAGQTLLENADLVGHCVHFLPIVSDVTENETVREHLVATRAKLLDAYDHQEFTYGTLLRKLPVHRDSSRLPLIEVQFNLEKVGSQVQFEGLIVDMQANPKHFVNTDLFLNVIETESDLTVDCDYNKGLIAESTMKRWLACFETILNGIVNTPEAAVSKIEILNDSERKRQLVEWNGTETDFGPFEAIHNTVERRAAETPDSIAVVCGSHRWSYRNLNDHANRIARALRRRSIVDGSLVGICLERSAEMVAAVLGVLKAGAAYVPLDPRHPAERLQLVLDDACVSLVLTESHLTERLRTSAEVLCLDSQRNVLARESSEDPGNVTHSGSVAYVIYTSGSTGKPKGVVIEHGSLTNLLRSMQREPGLAASDVMVAVTTLSFDIAGLELFLPMLAGARLVIANADQVYDGRLLRQLIESERATVLQATPATWRMLLEAGWRDVPRLKMLCGGEALPRDLAENLIANGGELWNLYGPTETTIWSALARVKSGSGPVPIGMPIANTQFRVLDGQRQLLPAGVPGELYIGGEGVARGYLRNPELDAQKFVPDSFARAGARIYRTGDLVRYLPDGSMEFLGRLDHQVKLRGFRIELGDVEAALRQHEALKEAVALTREDERGEKQLIAWVAPHSGQEVPSFPALRQFLQRKLPEYMLPASVVALESIPRTPNGKIDTRALQTPRLDSRRGAAEMIPARTDTEKVLAKIWSQVLRIDPVSVESSIFDLGGDSLSIFRITLLAGQKGLHFSPKDVFQHPTIAALARISDGRQPPRNGAQIPVIVRTSRDGHRRSRAVLGSN